MCGISVCMHGSSLSTMGVVGCFRRCTVSTVPVDMEQLKEVVCRRGPDATQQYATSQQVEGGQLSMEVQGSVLSLQRQYDATSQGGIMVAQPVYHQWPKHGDLQSPPLTSWLLWNGEVFGGPSIAMDALHNSGDTWLVFGALIRLEASAQQSSDSIAVFNASVVAFLEGIYGPFAFVYFAASLGSQGVLLFGRDPSGRRSLVVHRGVHGDHSVLPKDDGSSDAVAGSEAWIIASAAVPHVGLSTCHPLTTMVAADDESSASRKRGRGGDGDGEDSGGEAADDVVGGCWVEVPVGGIHVLNLNVGFAETGTTQQQQPYSFEAWRGCRMHALTHPLLRPLLNTPVATPLSSGITSLSDMDPRVAALVEHVGYYRRMDATSDAPLSVALQYLHHLARAVDIRIAPHTTGGEGIKRGRRSIEGEADGSRKEGEADGAPIALLFSGGLDSTVLACLVHALLPMEQPIELVNVAFGDHPEDTPDRISCVMAMRELLMLPSIGFPSERRKRRTYRLHVVNVTTAAVDAERHRILNLVFPRRTVMDYNIGTAIWFAAKGASSRKSVLTLLAADPDPLISSTASCAEMTMHKTCRLAGASASSAASASGVVGINDTATDENTPLRIFQPLLDALIAEGLEGESKGHVLLSTLGKEYGAVLTPAWRGGGYRKLAHYLSDAEAAGLVRFGGGSTSKYVCLQREADLELARRRIAFGRVESLRPFFKNHDDTHVNVDGACHRGEGDDTRVLESPVLLLGMGADETLGGYTRYRRVFERASRMEQASVSPRDAVDAELQRDFSRLWTRNLGRDDRVVSDHGKEGRFPFLDEGVLSSLEAIVAAASPSTGASGSSGRDYRHVFDVSLPEGVGDKKLLRTCARLLGLPNVSRLQKRAIQFGTRIADRKIQGAACLQRVLEKERKTE